MAGKQDVVRHVAQAVEGLSQRQASEVVDAVFGAITECLKRGEVVQLPGFGSFSVSERAARLGRNPATGETIKIPASTSARFRPAKNLKKYVNTGSTGPRGK